ncbi:hypothetical protein J7S78_13395 [Klebsiella oxytoca]|uniref:Uncharacterized protein n=1 Tax=Klebsiella oxytoca TaxID=571 RepID=A0AAP2BJ52_KLEOX|nr:hypothetical protein [Klebsiella oxytoca]MBQ0600786.1 hypothetical protein [Klebsiella oxytoca]
MHWLQAGLVDNFSDTGVSVKVKTETGWIETDKTAEFSHVLCAEEMMFCVTRSLDQNNLVVTHAETGWKVCDIDFLDFAQLGELKAAKKSLEEFISVISEKRFYAVILRVRG